MRQKELIVYKDVPDEQLFQDMCALLDAPAGANRGDLFYSCLHQLTEFAGHYGLQGNLWHCYIAFIIANHENQFSMACEIKGLQEGTINELARHDFKIFMEIMNCDWTVALGNCVGTEILHFMTNYKNREDNSKVFNKRIRDRICDLAVRLEQAADVDTFFDEVVAFYKEFGVGCLGLHKAFKIVHEPGEDAYLKPITCTEHVHFSDLQGYEAQKKKLVENTESFLRGKPANNCLLFGDAGTGKSSSIKALLNEYYDQGLRMIEVYKHQFQDLSAIINIIKDRNYKFIIFMDDLSFEEFEIEYKYLKAVIEGGLEKKPDNVLIYATSNRRHLIREKFSDKEEQDNDIHKNDTVQEKLSLVYRFGVTIYYGKPNPKEFKEILDKIATDSGIDMPREELYAKANAWELSHGGLSGRTARQFIMHLQGEED